jgi:hypothetical protein
MVDGEQVIPEGRGDGDSAECGPIVAAMEYLGQLEDTVYCIYVAKSCN